METLNLVQRLIQKSTEKKFDSVRKIATTLIKEKGLPSRKSEEYKYTNFCKILEKKIANNDNNLEKNSNSTINLKPLIPILAKNYLVFVNGILKEKLSSYAPSNQITITKLEKNKEHTPQAINKKSDEFLLLNTSNLTNGTAITIHKDTVIKAPIVLIHITDSSKNKVIAHPRTFISVKENSQATIAEVFIGIGNALSFTNAATEVNCATKSIFSYIKIGNENSNQLHVGNTQVSVAKKAVFNSIILNFGGKMIRNNLQIELNGTQCETNLYGLYVTNNKQHIDNHTVVNHKVPNCNSNELYKGIMDENSKGIFNGKIYVQPNAQITNAFQLNKNILLSDNATINTKPQLEIWADDVKCSHGCTVGKLDKEQLFYLRARGIGKRLAKLMLLDAYANEIVEKIKDEKIKTFVQKNLYKKIDT